MKKIAALFTIIIFIVTYTSNALCTADSKVFFNGGTHSLGNSVLTLEDENYVEAGDLAEIIGFTYGFNRLSRTFTLEQQQTESTWDLSDDKYIQGTPRLINNKVYLPFSFLQNTFHVSVKYNKNTGALYLFPSDLSVTGLETFTNLSYGYSLGGAGSIKPDIDSSEGNFDDSTMEFTDMEGTYTVTVSCDRIDQDTFAKMREYLNDHSSSEREIFKELTDLKQSYFRALKEYYKKDFLFGSNEQSLSESNIKVFKEYDEEIFGQKSHIAIYNIIKTDKDASTEKTLINILVPVYSTKTFYSIVFTTDKSSLDSRTLGKMSSFMKSMRISGLPGQWSDLTVFHDTKTLESANSGVYPDLATFKPTYCTLMNSKAGYRLTYPNVFIPYRQNDISYSYDYRSFKIDYNNFFSVSVEPVISSKPIQDKISVLKQLYDGNLKVVEEGSSTFGGKQFSYIKYEYMQGNVSTYIQDYFITNSALLYNIQLNSRLKQPSGRVQEEFEKILSSIQFISRSDGSSEEFQPFIKYLNREEGYTFSFPANWQLVENESSDINYEAFSIKSPDFSGPIDILVTEGELNSYLLHTEVAKFLSASNTEDFNKYFIKYSAPYMDRISRTLMSNYYIKDESIHLIKLVNYIDDSGRSKICYSKDILRGRKIYSLFITVSDYAAVDENMFGKDLKVVFNKIINSFTIENTVETFNRFMKGETRNRRVVFIEDYFKKVTGVPASVISASRDTSSGDILVTLDGIKDSGYYRVKMDFGKKQIQIVDKLLKADVLSEAVERLKQDYRNKEVKELVSHPEDMTLDLKFSEPAGAQTINRIYKVEPGLTAKGLTWKLLRKYDYHSLKNNCLDFLSQQSQNQANARFPSAQELADVISQGELDKTCFIPVYVEEKKASGYYVLEVNPVTDAIKTVSFTPLSDVYRQIENSYPRENDEYIAANQHISENSPYEIEVFLISKQRESFKLQTLKVRVDQETKELKVQ